MCYDSAQCMLVPPLPFHRAGVITVHAYMNACKCSCAPPQTPKAPQFGPYTDNGFFEESHEAYWRFWIERRPHSKCNCSGANVPKRIEICSASHTFKKIPPHSDPPVVDEAPKKIRQGPWRTFHVRRRVFGFGVEG